MYYKRISPLGSLDLYDNLVKNWSNRNNNNLHTDFEIYSTFEDAVNDRNPWQVCTYNKPNIGFPGVHTGCKKTPSSRQWGYEFPVGIFGGKHVAFSVINGW